MSASCLWLCNDRLASPLPHSLSSHDLVPTTHQNCMENFNNAKMTWIKSGAPVMGLKTQMRLKKRQIQIEKELEKRNQA